MYTIANFGSTCRADSDQHSDRDLLIICPPSQKSRLLKKYRKQGYSISFFTKNQLEGMKKCGSLFLQHLKSECSVIVDSGGDFHRFIESCEFIPPSQSELQRCEMAVTTVFAWPNASQTDSWKADWLYCVLRDYLVKKIANEHSLAFGISDISNYAIQEWGIAKNEIRCLGQLRLIKSIYRSGHTRARIKSNLFSDANKLFENIREYEDSISLDYPIDIELLDDTTLNTSYQWLRALEGMYILARSSGYIHPRHDELIKLIEQPNLYHSSSKFKHATIRTYYHDVLCELTAKKEIWKTTMPLRHATLYSVD